MTEMGHLRPVALQDLDENLCDYPGALEEAFA
jgi:hypothetical protein